MKKCCYHGQFETNETPSSSVSVSIVSVYLSVCGLDTELVVWILSLASSVFDSQLVGVWSRNFLKGLKTNHHKTLFLSQLFVWSNKDYFYFWCFVLLIFLWVGRSSFVGVSVYFRCLLDWGFVFYMDWRNITWYSSINIQKVNFTFFK